MMNHVGQQVQQRPGAEEQHAADGQRQAAHEQEALPGAVPDAVQLAGPVVLAHEGGEGGAEGAGDGPIGPVHLAAHGPGGHHHRAQGVDPHLQQHVRQPVHGALHPGGDADAQHLLEQGSVPLLPQPQPGGALQGQELDGHQPRRHGLGDQGGHGHAHHAPGEGDDEEHVQDHVEPAAHHQAEEGEAGVADGAEDPGAHVEQEQEDGAQEVDALIDQRKAEGVRRGLQQGQQLGREQAHQGAHAQAQQGAHPIGHGHGRGDPVVLLGPVELGDDHRRAAGQGHEEADDQVDQDGGAAAHRGEGRSAHELAHHEGVHRVVELLQQGPRGDGQKEGHQLFDDGPFGELVVGVHGDFLFLVQ